MTSAVPPSSDELTRVAAYWQWVSDMTCEHPVLVMAGSEPLTCGACRRPVQIVSDVQAEAMRGGR